MSLWYLRGPLYLQWSGPTRNANLLLSQPHHHPKPPHRTTALKRYRTDQELQREARMDRHLSQSWTFHLNPETLLAAFQRIISQTHFRKLIEPWPQQHQEVPARVDMEFRVREGLPRQALTFPLSLWDPLLPRLVPRVATKGKKNLQEYSVSCPEREGGTEAQKRGKGAFWVKMGPESLFILDGAFSNMSLNDTLLESAWIDVRFGDRGKDIEFSLSDRFSIGDWTPHQPPTIDYGHTDRAATLTNWQPSADSHNHFPPLSPWCAGCVMTASSRRRQTY
jgi:hypothetical protein